MTLEEAQSLKPGDIISGASRDNRILAAVKVDIGSKMLLWDELRNSGVIDRGHSYSYEKMTIAKRAEPVVPKVIDTYPIY